MTTKNLQLQTHTCFNPLINDYEGNEDSENVASVKAKNAI